VVLTADPAAETGPLAVPGAPITGTLLGGNLCLIASSVGTCDQPDLRGAVLLIEEVEEPPYKVDRMLTHLRRCGALDQVAGFAVGQFTRCADEWPMSIVDVLLDRLGDLGVPVLGGLPVGHGPGALTVPLGVPATLDVAAGTLTAAPAVRVQRAGGA
jgi:muramoyltetrapeptide carboxypeptidase